jgi:apolipoprotein D and lipocalin family protein
MKVRVYAQAFVGLLLCLLGTSQAKGSIFPSTVEQVDLNRYVGKWYEIQSTKPFFQKGCVCITAEYRQRDDGNIDIINRCRDSTPEGHERVFEGLAVASSDPAKLYVSSGGIPSPVPNYWIVDLAPDYSYAVVSSFLRTPVWILSRTPELEEEILAGIYDRLRQNRFDPNALTPTLQNGCSN